jgi:hypothetical protein
MGDTTDEFYYDLDHEFDNGWVNHGEIQENIWVTKDGRHIMIKDMNDKHLLNAYKVSGREDLFAEMVVRLFESRVKPVGVFL